MWRSDWSLLSKPYTDGAVLGDILVAVIASFCFDLFTDSIQSIL